MSVKVSLFKSTADGEQLNTEWQLEPRDYDRLKKGEDLREIFAPYLKFADSRLLEMNLRIMFANKMVRSQPPEFQVAYHNVMDVLHGQKPTDATFIQVLQQAVQQTVTDLATQGIDPKQVIGVARSAYGDQAIPPEMLEQMLKDTPGE